MQNKLLALVLLVAFLSHPLLAQKRVLLEHYTSSWCGECPNANLIADQIAADHPGRVILAYHHSSVDPMANPHSTVWKNELSIPGTPLGVIDRTPVSSSGPIFATTGNWASIVETQLEEPDYLDLGISFEPQPAEGPLSFEVSLRLLEELPETGELHLSVMVVEDSVQSSEPGYQQSNYYNEVEGHPLFGLGGSIPFYPFMNVVRDIVSDTWGTTANFPAELEVGTDYTWTSTFELESNWDPKQLRLIVVATLHDEDDIRSRPVLDASEVSIGDQLITSSNNPQAAKLEFKAFPNPAYDRLNLRFPAIGDYQLDLSDMLGRPVYMESILGKQDHEVSVSGLPNGFYVLKVVNKYGMLGLEKVTIK